MFNTLQKKKAKIIIPLQFSLHKLKTITSEQQTSSLLVKNLTFSCKPSIFCGSLIGINEHSLCSRFSILCEISCKFEPLSINTRKNTKN